MTYEYLPPVSFAFATHNESLCDSPPSYADQRLGTFLAVTSNVPSAARWLILTIRLCLIACKPIDPFTTE